MVHKFNETTRIAHAIALCVDTPNDIKLTKQQFRNNNNNELFLATMNNCLENIRIHRAAESF